jgi:putative transposase
MRAKTAISKRRACGLLALSRTVLHYGSGATTPNEQLRTRIKQLAAEQRRFGYRRIHALLRREGG